MGTQTNVTASRALNTTYQNTTGNDIFVSATVSDNSPGNLYLRISEDGVTFDTLLLYRPSGQTNAYYFASGWVPDQYYYRMDASSVFLEYWWEYELIVSSGSSSPTAIMSGMNGTTTCTTGETIECYADYQLTIADQGILFGLGLLVLCLGIIVWNSLTKSLE